MHVCVYMHVCICACSYISYFTVCWIMENSILHVLLHAMQSQHPDGHRAPIRDLVGRPPVCTPTPPHSLGLTGHAYPPSQSPSPYTYSPHPMSPIQASHSASFTETSDTPTGMYCTCVYIPAPLQIGLVTILVECRLNYCMPYR